MFAGASELQSISPKLADRQNAPFNLHSSTTSPTGPKVEIVTSFL